MDELASQLHAELAAIWRAHARVGLAGQMLLYSAESQNPWRSREPGIKHWFGPEGIDEAVALILHHYNQGSLPNTPLLLNPIVHVDGKPVGSGIVWATSLALGVEHLDHSACERLDALGVAYGMFERGDNPQAGLKIVMPLTRTAAPMENGLSVEGCNDLFELANQVSKAYAPYYLLSGISYLSTHGLFLHPDASTLLAGEPIALQSIVDANYCWNAYGRHHSLYTKFGTNTADVPQNLKFFTLVARDTTLFDATGPMRADADEGFEFLVDGMIPRGSVTLLAASGGTGKSSAAHYLAVLAATDWKEEEKPRWMGQKINKDAAQGIVVYFSGEDSPAIVNARARLFDPTQRASRLMFQRTDFIDGTFAQFLKYLQKIPSVPLMVIDPARKYLSGDENDAKVVSEFFETIEEFAHKKNTAVVVVHHLEKNAYPKSAHQVLDMLRGSQVFIDRPRVVLGMYRDGPHTVVGLAKNNIPPNMGMVMEERVFARDPEKLQLIWLPGKEGVRSEFLSHEELEQLAKQSREEHG